MVIKDSYTLDLTFNPDFSQIESDAPQVTVNQRYLVVYPEKRPFFMENSSVFHTPQTLFFSRKHCRSAVRSEADGIARPMERRSNRRRRPCPRTKRRYR